MFPVEISMQLRKRGSVVQDCLFRGEHNNTR